MARFSLDFGWFPSLMPVIVFFPLSPCLRISEVFGCQVVGVFIFLRYATRTSILENHREESLIKCKRHPAAFPPPPWIHLPLVAVPVLVVWLFLRVVALYIYAVDKRESATESGAVTRLLLWSHDNGL